MPSSFLSKSLLYQERNLVTPLHSESLASIMTAYFSRPKTSSSNTSKRSSPSP